jgi:hypothetical protein
MPTVHELICKFNEILSSKKDSLKLEIAGNRYTPGLEQAQNAFYRYIREKYFSSLNLEELNEEIIKNLRTVTHPHDCRRFFEVTDSYIIEKINARDFSALNGLNLHGLIKTKMVKTLTINHAVAFANEAASCIIAANLSYSISGGAYPIKALEDNLNKISHILEHYIGESHLHFT